jgi:hypothetical protein
MLELLGGSFFGFNFDFKYFGVGANKEEGAK